MGGGGPFIEKYGIPEVPPPPPWIEPSTLTLTPLNKMLCIKYYIETSDSIILVCQ